MEYRSFFLENYKGIQKRIDFNLDMKVEVPHCILGNNESGKTTILKGFELINDLCRGHKIKNGEINAIKPKGNYFNGTVKIGAVLKVTSEHKKLMIEKHKTLEIHFKGNKKCDISLEFSYEFKDSSLVKSGIEIDFNGSLITDGKTQAQIFDLVNSYAPEVIYYDDFKFSVPSTIRFSHSGSEIDDDLLKSKSNRHWQDIFTDILRGGNPRANTFQTDVIDWSHNTNNDPNIVKGRISDMGEHLNEILEEWIKNNESNIRGFEISRKENENSSIHDYQISIKSGRNFYQMNERSKGMQWSFCFNILTRIRKNRHGSGFIFLLDEPASNLHISLQDKMLNHLKDLCKDTAMVIYSTHAPQLIDITHEKYDYIFVAKNHSGELEDTDIKLHKLNGKNKNISVLDLEPILAKLSYEGVKGMGKGKNEDEKKEGEKKLWEKVGEKINPTKNQSKTSSTEPKKGSFSVLLEYSSKLVNLYNFIANYVRPLG